MNPLEYRVPDRAESRTARRRILFRITIVILSVVVVILTGVVITFLVISRRIDENLRKADNYIAGESVVLAKDPRFQNVDLEHFTKLDGSVLVSGSVDTQSDLSALKRTIDTSAPPVPALYDVQVLATTRSTTAAATRGS
jgi:cytoskeletal protein RodZ